ncbi:MAG: argininosuccinate synthase [Alphaproteobacteria bacterium GM7ARS4]|nr:argininosuccinate synthase [Alphaproteobacteria bacterium GM7ARS4]
MASNTRPQIKKVVLAYSGGLDTSVILRWLQEHYGCEVATFTADIGQGEEVEEAREKAVALGVKDIFIEDLRDRFTRDYVFPMLRANPLYEGVYMLGTAIARPLIARRQIEIAHKIGADAVAHGATGKGNDQIRFELGYYATDPHIHVVAPWREWDLTSREDLLRYAQEHHIPIAKDSEDKPPYSMDANLLHISYEGKALEDPWQAPDDAMYLRTKSPAMAVDKAERIEIGYRQGDAVTLNGKAYSPSQLLAALNEKAGQHGVGRVDMVENRFIGMKSRGVYETPGGTVLMAAHRGLESITLDREALHLKESLMPRYAACIYNGLWFSPERLMMQALIDESQTYVNGVVRLCLYKGNVMVEGRTSDDSLYDTALATFESDDVYHQGDAEGFIRLHALRLRVLASKRRKALCGNTKET